MADNEIIKALECCGENPPRCSECDYKGRCNKIDCYDYLKRDTLSLINSQQAEIERLITQNFDLAEKGEKVCIALKTAKAEAVKEFAKLLVDKSKDGVISVCDLSDYVKEAEQALKEIGKEDEWK